MASSPRKGADPRDRYQLVQKIGEGGYGSVFKAYDVVTSTTVAVKLIDLEDVGDELDDVHQEIAVMSDVNCPQLIKYYASYIIGMNLWIIMEFLEAGSLSDILKESGPLDEASIAYVMRELLMALTYLHSQRKIHRDVKAGNLLLSAEGSVRLADFGVTGQLTDSMDKRKTRVGTPFWMAPEVITQSLYDGCADIWSAGITAIELAKGLPPYAREVHPMQVIFMIPKNPPPTLEGDFSNEMKDFIASCLKKNPAERPSAADLLQHDFIRNATKPASFDAIIHRKIESSLAQMEADAALLESRGMTRISSMDSGWDFTARSGYNSINMSSSSSSGALGEIWNSRAVSSGSMVTAPVRGDDEATTRVMRRYRSQETELGALPDLVRERERQLYNSRHVTDMSPRLSPTLSPVQDRRHMGGTVQREPFTPIRFVGSSDSSDGDIDAKIDRAQAYIASRGISASTVDSQSSGTCSSLSGTSAAGSKGLISSHSHVTWDRDAPTPPRHRHGRSESHSFFKEDSQTRLEHHRSNSSKDGVLVGGVKSDKSGDDRAQRPKPLAWTPGRRRAVDSEPVEIFEKRPAYQFGGGHALSSDSDNNDSIATHSSEELKRSQESEEAAGAGGVGVVASSGSLSKQVSRVSSLASVDNLHIRSSSTASSDNLRTASLGSDGGRQLRSGSVEALSPRERLEHYHDRERQLHMRRQTARDRERDSGAGLAPFKSVLDVLLRNQVNKMGKLSPLFENVIRPALQKISDIANEPPPPPPPKSSSSLKSIEGMASRARYALERGDSVAPTGDDGKKESEKTEQADAQSQSHPQLSEAELARQRRLAALQAEAQAEERRLAAAAEEHRRETKDLVTVLIAALTALDQHTEGELTNELTTTMMGFMMEELDGNVF